MSVEHTCLPCVSFLFSSSACFHLLAPSAWYGVRPRRPTRMTSADCTPPDASNTLTPCWEGEGEGDEEDGDGDGKMRRREEGRDREMVVNFLWGWCYSVLLGANR